MRKGARDHLWIVHSLTHSFIHSRPLLGLCLALMPGSEGEQTTLPAVREPTVRQRAQGPCGVPGETQACSNGGFWEKLTPVLSFRASL